MSIVRVFLTLAFVAAALAEIADERLAEDLRRRLENWLDRHSRPGAS